MSLPDHISTPLKAIIATTTTVSLFLLAACGAKGTQEEGSNLQPVEAVDTGMYDLQAAGPGNDPTHLTEGLEPPMTEYYAIASPDIDAHDALDWHMVLVEPARR